MCGKAGAGTGRIEVVGRGRSVDGVYEYLDRPPLSQRALQRALVRDGSPWTDVTVVASTGSTNADLLAAAAGGAPTGRVLIAEEQTSARGRQERAWTSPPQAGLTWSVLLRPTVPPNRWGWLPLLAGLSLVRVVRLLGEIDATLKWPNDLLVGPEEGKAAGILAQAARDAVVVGVGLNVSNRREDLPTAQATSLALAGAACTDRATLLPALLRQFAEDFVAWSDADGDPQASGLAAAYARACGTLGRQVRMQLPGERETTGLATGIDDAGRLVVCGDTGASHAYAAGDVVHLR